MFRRGNPQGAVRARFALLARKMTTQPIATVGPSSRYWLGLLFIPLATFFVLTITLGIYVEVSGANFSRPSFFSVWAALTIFLLGWSIIRDRQNLTWSLTNTEIWRGNGIPNLVIPFDEIESIVIGLPSHLPWFLRLARVHPASHAAHQNLVTVRSTALLLRMSGRRLMPLTFLTGQYRGGEQMREFLRLNAAKIVGRDTYSDAEIRCLATASLNTIRVVCSPST
jgi:hypothetical protein